MESNLNKLDGNKVQLEIEVDETRVENALHKAYQEMKNSIELPGFRKGRAPRSLIERHYGPEVFYRDAIDSLLPEAYREALEETDIEPIAQPEIEDLNFEKGQPMTFRAVVEVKPEVDVGEYLGVEVGERKTEVTEEEKEEVLENFLERHASLEEADREIVEYGDFVVLDAEAYVDGETYEDGSLEGITLEIGGERFIPGFGEQLVGAKLDEKVEVEVELPAEFDEDLAGRTAVFEVVIQAIKEKNIPELDEELAEQVGDYDDAEALKADLLDSYREQKDQEAKRRMGDELLDTIAEDSEYILPEVLIDRELDSLLNDMRFRLASQGIPFADYLERTGITEEELRGQYRELAERRVGHRLILDTIAQKEDIEVSDEEIDERIEEIAENRQQDPDEMRQYLKEEDRLEPMREEMIREKTLDFLLDNAEKIEREPEEYEEEEKSEIWTPGGKTASDEGELDDPDKKIVTPSSDPELE